MDSTDRRDLESAVRNTRRVPLGELAGRGADSTRSDGEFNSSI